MDDLFFLLPGTHWQAHDAAKLSELLRSCGMNADHYTYRVIWSAEDGEYAGLCAEFPSLSRLEQTQEGAFAGIRQLLADCIEDT